MALPLVGNPKKGLPGSLSASAFLALRGNFFFVYLAGALLMVYLPPLLKQNPDITDARLGFIFMCRAIVGLAVPPIWGVLADMTGHRARMLMALCLASACTFALLGGVHGYGAVLATLVVFAVMNAPVNSISTSLTFEILGPGNRPRFAGIRLFGTLGFIAGSFCGGYFMGFFGVGAMPAFFGIVMFMACLSLFPVASTVQPKQKHGRITLLPLLKNKKLLVLFSILITFGVADYMAYTFLSIYARTLGASPAQVGWIWTIGSLAEACLMPFMGKILVKIPLKWIIVMGGAAIACKWMPMAFIRDWKMMVPFQLLHSVAICFMQVGVITYLDTEAPHNLKTSALALYSLVVTGAGSVIGSLSGGVISQNFGYRMLYAVSGSFAAAGTILLILFLKKPSEAAGLPELDKYEVEEFTVA